MDAVGTDSHIYAVDYMMQDRLGILSGAHAKVYVAHVEHTMSNRRRSKRPMDATAETDTENAGARLEMRLAWTTSTCSLLSMTPPLPCEHSAWGWFSGSRRIGDALGGSTVNAQSAPPLLSCYPQRPCAREDRLDPPATRPLRPPP